MTVAELVEELYSKHYWGLLALARENCGGLDAEALVHDAFILFSEHFDPDGKAPPLAWLRLTLKRHCWSTYKREKRQIPRDTLPGGDLALSEEARMTRTEPPDDIVVRREAVSEVFQTMDRLKPAERAALVDLGLGFSYKEIEARRGWTYTKINRCIAEGRAALKAAT